MDIKRFNQITYKILILVVLFSYLVLDVKLGILGLNELSDIEKDLLFATMLPVGLWLWIAYEIGFFDKEVREEARTVESLKLEIERLKARNAELTIQNQSLIARVMLKGD